MEGTLQLKSLINGNELYVACQFIYIFILRLHSIPDILVIPDL